MRTVEDDVAGVAPQRNPAEVHLDAHNAVPARTPTLMIAANRTLPSRAPPWCADDPDHRSATDPR